ncbi:MAG: hypothetical protein V4549_06710 [Bacteroidota bacterium]
MTADIAAIIRGYIDNLPFVDKIGGLVKPLSLVRTEDGGRVIKKIIPIDCSVTHADCIKGRYTDLIPNSKYKSVIYFEDGGTIKVNDGRADFAFQSNLKMVCWLNLKLLGKDNCSVSALAIASILDAIPNNFINSSPYTRIQITCSGEDPKSPAIFSKYTYDENAIQYLMYPYDYFALNFQVKYVIPRGCITGLTPSAEIDCIDNKNE